MVKFPVCKITSKKLFAEFLDQAKKDGKRPAHFMSGAHCCIIYPYVRYDRDGVFGCYKFHADKTLLMDFQEFYDLVYADSPEPIMIGEHVVEFFEDTIKVGCEDIPHEVVDKIYKRIHDED
ncbi:MAG: hypothetical protein ACYSUK_00080 [Planctomycetota bacterium]|jgi:hypothetical protein